MWRSANISGKVALGYIVVLILLIGTIYYVTVLTSDLGRQDTEMERLTAERMESEQLVMAVLDCQTAAAAASLGNSEDIALFHSAVDSATSAIDRMEAADTTCRAMLDSLSAAIMARRDNVLQLASLMTGRDEFDAYTRQIGDLVEKNDTSRQHTQTIQQVVVQQKEVTVNKPRRNFFGRVADVFRPGRADTVNTEINNRSVRVDTVTTIATQSNGMSTSLENINRNMISRMNRRNRQLSQQITAAREAGVAISVQMSRLLTTLQQASKAQFERRSAEIVAQRHRSLTLLCVIALFAIFWVGILFLITRRDVRRAARYRDETEEARDRAERLLDEREKLLLTIAHNIKSPASAVSGYASLLAKTPLSDAQLKDVGCIAGSASHLMQLVTTLLDYNKLQKGMMEVRYKPFALRDLIVDIVEAAAPMSTGKGLTIKAVDIPAVNIVSDPLILRQIIENLVSNAVKYTREGGVSVTATLADERLTVSVADTGIGLTDEERQHVFDEFVRLEGSHGSEGAGLGLAITLSLVHLLGGSIAIDSQKGAGSTFSVTVPAQTTDEGEPIQPADDAASGPLDGIDSDAKIIVVDDDEIQRRLTTTVLNKSGFNCVVSCESARGALDLMAVMHPDVIITDLRMPEMDGRALAAEVRRIAPEITIIGLTANIDTDNDGLFDRVLSKPLQLPDTKTTEGTATHRADLSALTVFADGDAEAERQILDTFATDCAANVSRLSHDKTTGDIADAAECAHKMLPTFTLIGATCVDALRYLESRRGANSMNDNDRVAITSVETFISGHALTNVNNGVGK